MLSSLFFPLVQQELGLGIRTKPTVTKAFLIYSGWETDMKEDYVGWRP